VEYIKDYAFISIFNKNHGKEATEACQYLSILRPELIIPTIVDKLIQNFFFLLIENFILDSFHRLIVSLIPIVLHQLCIVLHALHVRWSNILKDKHMSYHY